MKSGARGSFRADIVPRGGPAVLGAAHDRQDGLACARGYARRVELRAWCTFRSCCWADIFSHTASFARERPERSSDRQFSTFPCSRWFWLLATCCSRSRLPPASFLVQRRLTRHSCCLAYWRSRQLCLLFLVSATAPLASVLVCAHAASSGDDPYFLYAASNAGSLTALVAYPLVIEPAFELEFAEPALAVWVSLAGDFDSLLRCDCSTVEPVNRT